MAPYTKTMTRIPITKDGLALLRKQAKAAVKAGNSPLSQYSGLVFVLDRKEIPFTDVLRDSGGAAQSGGAHKDDVRVNRDCPDNHEHRMHDGTYMCGRQHGAGHGTKQCGCGPPQSGGQRGPIGGQTRFILAKNVAP